MARFERDDYNNWQFEEKATGRAFQREPYRNPDYQTDNVQERYGGVEFSGRYPERGRERPDEEVDGRLYGRPARSADGALPRRYLEQPVREETGADRWVRPADYDQFGDKWTQREIYDYSDRKAPETSVHETPQRVYSTPYPQAGEYLSRKTDDWHLKEAQPDAARRMTLDDPWAKYREERQKAELDKHKLRSQLHEGEWLGYDDPAYIERRDSLISNRDDPLTYKRDVYGQPAMPSSRRPAETQPAKHTAEYTYTDRTYQDPAYQDPAYQDPTYRVPAYRDSAYGVGGQRAESRPAAAGEWAAYDRPRYGQSDGAVRSQYSAAARTARPDDQVAYRDAGYGASDTAARRHNSLLAAAADDGAQWAYSEAAYRRPRAPPAGKDVAASGGQYQQEGRLPAQERAYETLATKQEAYSYPQAYGPDPARDEARRRQTDEYDRDMYAYSYPPAGVEVWK